MVPCYTAKKSKRYLAASVFFLYCQQNLDNAHKQCFTYVHSIRPINVYRISIINVPTYLTYTLVNYAVEGSSERDLIISDKLYSFHPPKFAEYHLTFFLNLFSFWHFQDCEKKSR